VLEQRLGEAVREAVVHDPSVLSGLHETGSAQEPQAVTDRVLAHIECERKVADAELVHELERVKDAHAHGVGEQGQQAGKPGGVLGSEAPTTGLGNSPLIHGMFVIEQWAR
jgi:hypothetical protein